MVNRVRRSLSAISGEGFSGSKSLVPWRGGLGEATPGLLASVASKLGGRPQEGLAEP